MEILCNFHGGYTSADLQDVFVHGPKWTKYLLYQEGEK